MTRIIEQNLAGSTGSPCVRRCCLNDDDVCVGCFRTLEEIKNWQGSTDQQKQQVLRACQRRRYRGA